MTTDLSHASNQQTFVKNLIIYNNSNMFNPLISLNNKAAMQINGQASYVKDNFVCGMAGVFFLQGISRLQIEDMTFTNNFAFYGAIFNSESLNTIVCNSCKFKSNLAATASIAYIYNNGQILIDNGEFDLNYAIYYDLFYFNNNYLTTSIIKNSVFNSNDLSLPEGGYYQKILDTIQSKFDRALALSFLEQTVKNLKQTSSIQTFRSSLLIKNTTILNQINFL